MTSRLRAATTLLLTGASTWALAEPLAHVLPAPPVASPGEWALWIRATDPATAAFTVLRLAGLGTAVLLGLGVAATGIAVLADGRSALAPVRAVSGLVPTPILASAALLLGVAAAGCARAPAAPVTGSRPAGPPATVSITRAANAPAEAVAGARAGGAAGAGGGRATSPGTASPVIGTAAADAAPAALLATTWTVMPGQDFYRIAAAVVAARGGRPAEVGAYWLRLLAANPRRNPDLIFPGERIVLPPFPD